MNKLPTYVLATDETLDRGVVMQTEPPYIIAKPYCIAIKDRNKLIEQAQTMRERKYPIVKVEGFTVFLSVWSTLEGDSVSYEEAMPILREMADYYLHEKILKKRFPFKDCDEERDAEWFEELRKRGQYFKEKKARIKRQRLATNLATTTDK